jgi:WD40 repeat protein
MIKMMRKNTCNRKNGNQFDSNFFYNNAIFLSIFYMRLLIYFIFTFVVVIQNRFLTIIEFQYCIIFNCSISMKSRRKTYAFIFLLVLFHTCDNWCLIQSWKETVTNGVTVPVDYSPDGKKIAVGGMSDGSVHIYDGASFSLINVIANNTGSIAKSVRISSNNILAIGYVNGILKVYNLATNASISNNANTSQTFIFTVDFTLNGSQLAVCGVGTNPLVLYNVTGTTISAAINSPSGNNYQDC